MEAEYEVLIYHTEVRWLSRENDLKRLFEIRQKFHLF
jgi:hypothetical protein